MFNEWGKENKIFTGRKRCEPGIIEGTYAQSFLSDMYMYLFRVVIASLNSFTKYRQLKEQASVKEYFMKF